jgi:hypothetical protein
MRECLYGKLVSMLTSQNNLPLLIVKLNLNKFITVLQLNKNNSNFYRQLQKFVLIVALSCVLVQEDIYMTMNKI